jgi:hypothetical protein
MDPQSLTSRNILGRGLALQQPRKENLAEGKRQGFWCLALEAGWGVEGEGDGWGGEVQVRCRGEGVGGEGGGRGVGSCMEGGRFVCCEGVAEEGQGVGGCHGRCW